MARTKKTAVESETPSTAPKTRGIDLQEVEARVTALDKAKRRSYDIFDIEQRVYNLEKSGTSPTPPTPSGDELTFMDIAYFWDSRSSSPAIMSTKELKMIVNDTDNSWTASCGFNFKIDGKEYTKVDFDVDAVLVDYGAIQVVTRDESLLGSISVLSTQQADKLLNENPNGGETITLSNQHFSVNIPSNHKKYLYIATVTGCNGEGEWANTYNGSATVIIKNVRFS